jgi:2-polyprenyl-3-methyl-5-hydroxy-6-metoxy-1,4-benzoquinol methylase
MVRAGSRQHGAKGDEMGTPADTTKFIPALRFRALTRFYDGVVRTLLDEEAFKARLLRQARIEAGQRVLDVGCGTGTLTIMAKRAQPEAIVFGLDADRETLDIARSKADEGGVAIELRRGLASEPPFEPGTFDRVISSLLLHHLTTEDKRRGLAAAKALLRPGGEIHIADWGRAQSLSMRLAFLAVQLLDGFATTTDNVRGRIPELMAEAGFRAIEETHRERTIFGTLSLYKGVAPA